MPQPEPPIEGESAFTVFAQREDAGIELSTWQRHAEQFFHARLTLREEKQYPYGFPEVDSVRVAIVPEGGREEVRECHARPRTDDDLRAAEDADARVGPTGLALLAKRCRMVWRIDCQGEDDRGALLLAAVLASVVLGPILSPDAQELFGVRTARLKLEGSAGPYR